MHFADTKTRGSDESRRALFDRYMPRIMQCRLEDLVHKLSDSVADF